MAYNKNSGESRLRKDVSQNTYVNKKNKDIFKNSQTTAPSSPPKPQYKTNYSWDIPDMDMKQKETENKQERLSFKDIVIIVIANGFIPVAGGFVYYIVLASKGERQKAMQSLVLSAIVSLIRIIYLVNTN
jgi:hypothetical protein